VNLLAALDGAPDHAQRCSVAASCESACVAMREHSAFVGHQFCAVGSHGFAGGNVFVIHGESIGEQRLLNLRQVCPAGSQPGEQSLHAIDGPEEIDSCRTRSCKNLADMREFRCELFGGFGVGLFGSQSDAHGR
jgi:hypothetical protein